MTDSRHLPDASTGLLEHPVHTPSEESPAPGDVGKATILRPLMGLFLMFGLVFSLLAGKWLGLLLWLILVPGLPTFALLGKWPGLLGLILGLGLLLFIYGEKVPEGKIKTILRGLLGLLLALGLLVVVVYGEKAKKILLGLAKTMLLGLAELILAFGLLSIVLTVWDYWRIDSHVPDGTPMFTSTSPDNRFTVAGYPSPTIFPRFAMPGQGGDGPALIILRDNRTGKELQRRHVDGPWFIYEDVTWYKDSVELARGDGIKWRLPQ